MPEPRPLNLALQGGGAHGAFAWGILDRLLEDGRFTFEGIAATSAGSMNAVALAQGLLDGGPDGARASLDGFWRAVSEAGRLYSPIRRLPWETPQGWQFEPPASFALFDAVTRVISPYQFNPLNLNPLRDILDARIDFAALREASPVKLFLNATNVRNGRGRIFRNHQLSAEAVMATACLPFLYQAVEIDGEAYWDGGYVGNPALYPLFYECVCGDVLLLPLNPLECVDVPTTGAEITDRINEVSFNASLLAELRAVAFVQKLIERDWLTEEAKERYRFVRVHVIRADKALGELGASTKFAWEWPFLSGLRDSGRAAAEWWLAEHGDDVGTRAGVDLKAMFLDTDG
jgi:NTE family protein